MVARVISLLALLAVTPAVGEAQGEEAQPKADLGPLVTEVLGAADEAARAAVLAEHPEARTDDFVFAILTMAEDLINKGEFDRALQAQGIARAIAVDAKLPPLTIAICDWMRSMSLQEAGRLAEAAEVLALANQAVQDSGNAGLICLIQQDRAQVLEDLGRLSEAREVVGATLELARKVGDADLIVDAAARAVSIETALGDLNAALRRAQEAAEASETAKKASTKAHARKALGDVYADLGDPAAALESHTKALQVYRESDNVMGTASALNACAVDQRNLGRYREALASYEEAMQWAARGKRPIMIATVQDNMGSVLQSLGEYEKAAELHAKARDTHREIGDPDGEASALNHLGLLEKRLGHLEASLGYYTEALTLYEKMGSVPNQITILVNQANMLDVAGRRDDALERGRKAIQLCDLLAANPELAAVTYFNVAQLHRNLGREDTYRECLARADALSRQNCSPATRGAILGSLAEVREADGDREGADALREQALALSPASSPDYLDVLSSQTRAVSFRSERARAVQLAEQGLSLAGDLNDRRHRLTFLILLGTALLPHDKELPNEVPPEPSRAVECLEEAATLAVDLSAPDMIHMAHYLCGKAYVCLDDDRKCLDHFLAAADALEGMRREVGGPAQRLRLTADSARLYRRIAIRYAALDDTANAFAYAEGTKGRVLAEMLAERQLMQSAGGEGSATLLEREQQALARIGTASQMLRDEESKPVERRNEEALKHWAEVRAQAEDDTRFVRLEMRRQHPGYASLRYPEPVAMAEAQALVPDGSALIQYVLGEESAIAIVLTRSRAGTVVLPATPREIADAWAKMNATLQMSNTRDPQADASGFAGRAHELYVACLQPVLEALGPGTFRLMIVPDGVLHHVPFAALVSEAPGPGKASYSSLSYVGLTRTISYLPSATVLKVLNGSPPPATDTRRLVAFCDPLLDTYAGGETVAARPADAAVTRALDTWQPLAQARKEGSRVASLWGQDATVYVGKQADERTAKAELLRAGCAHFAVHGVADDQSPLYSALALTPAPATETEAAEDGLLYAYEVMALQQMPSLVVLSACETALGAETEGEGLVGLVRAFLASGSRAVVASLWKVDDQATAALMRECYQRLRGGLPLDEALAEAQRRAARGSLKGAGYASGPHFWAAFGAYGNPLYEWDAGRGM
ncbi:MAG: CHAT domain-containing protein [Armatimonadetes bacterium]|nr:CHAT domain-containing protein [Armatimonadota bacterium]